MSKLEKYFGVDDNKKLSNTKLNIRSNRYLARLEENRVLKEVNSLFAKGLFNQCLPLLKKAVKLIPHNPIPFYLLGLIHEENKNYEKAFIAFTTAAILKKNDTTFWKMAYDVSLKTKNDQKRVLAIERIYKKCPSETLLREKLEIYTKMNKKFYILASQIELFNYVGIDNNIFRKFDQTQHQNSLKIVARKLFKCIKDNKQAQKMHFIEETIFVLYKTRNWSKINYLLDKFYFKLFNEIRPEIKLIYFIASSNLNETRYDSLLDYSKLLCDDSLWKSITEPKYIYDLADNFKNHGESEKAIEVIEKMLAFNNTSKGNEVLGDYNFSLNKLDEALNCYNRVILSEPTNELIKSKIYSLYTQMGHLEMAKVYKIPQKIQEYVHSNDLMVREDYRYTLDRCRSVKELFLESLILADEDICSYYDFVKDLIDDFIKNPFIILKNEKFKSFKNKHEVVNIKKLIAGDQSNIYKYQLGEGYNSAKLYNKSQPLDKVFSNKDVDKETNSAHGSDDGFSSELPNKDQLIYKSNESNNDISGLKPSNEFSFFNENQLKYKSNHDNNQDFVNKDQLIYKSNENSDAVKEFIEKYQITQEISSNNIKKEGTFSDFECNESTKNNIFIPELVMNDHNSDEMTNIKNINNILEDIIENENTDVTISNVNKCGIKLHERNAIAFFDQNILHSNYSNKKEQKRLADKLIRVTSLHGLDVEEWYNLIKLSLFSLIYQQKLDDASELLDYAFEADIFVRNSVIHNELCMIGLRIGLMLYDFEYIIRISNRLIESVDYTALYLFFALCHLFPGYHKNNMFSSLLRSLQRQQKKETGEDELGSSFISTYMPNYLQTESVDIINTMNSSRSSFIVLQGIINISHTKSRRLDDKRKYATKGINYLKSIVVESMEKTYNLAKAYHFFGFYDHAENLYFQVIDRADEELKRMAIYNMSLIFRQNKSRLVTESFLKKHM